MAATLEQLLIEINLCQEALKKIQAMKPELSCNKQVAEKVHTSYSLLQEASILLDYEAKML